MMFLSKLSDSSSNVISQHESLIESNVTSSGNFHSWPSLGLYTCQVLSSLWFVWPARMFILVSSFIVKRFWPVTLLTSLHTSWPRALIICFRFVNRPLMNLRKRTKIIFLACFPWVSCSTSQQLVSWCSSNMILTFVLKLLHNCWKIFDEKSQIFDPVKCELWIRNSFSFTSGVAKWY